MSAKLTIPTALLLIVSVATAQGPTDTSTYGQLLRRLQAHDSTLDFTRLRLAYASSPEYGPDPHVSSLDSLGPAFARRDFPRARLLADSVLAQFPLEIRPRILRAYAAEQLGDSAAASWDRWVAAKLVRSITNSGDGTEKRPYVVISVAEEYATLSMLGYARSGTQTDGSCGKHECDILETQERNTGRARTFYFNIDLPQAYLRRLLQTQ